MNKKFLIDLSIDRTPLGQRLEVMRRNMKMTRAKLVKKMRGTHHMHIYGVESGKLPLTPRKAVIYASALGVADHEMMEMLIEEKAEFIIRKYMEEKWKLKKKKRVIGAAKK